MKVKHPFLYIGLFIFLIISILIIIIMFNFGFINNKGDINIKIIEKFAIKNEYPGGMNRVDKIYILGNESDSQNIETMLKCNWIMMNKIIYGLNIIIKI